MTFAFDNQYELGGGALSVYPPAKRNVGRGRMKLLLIESSILLRKRLAAMLNSLGCVEIVEASAVEEASQVISAMRPEVVIMGAQLPDESGLDVLAWARIECPSACLIVVSSHSSEPYRKRWLQAGADHFLDLSAQIDLLLNVVRYHCKTHLCSMP